MRYVLEYKDESERDNANVIKTETRKTQISSGCQKQLTNLPPDESLNNLIEFLKTQGVDEQAMAMDGEGWKLEFELQKKIETGEDDDEEEEDEDDDEEKKGDDDDDKEEFSPTMTEVVKLELEFIENEADSQNYLQVRKLKGPIMLYRELWNNILENVALHN